MTGPHAMRGRRRLRWVMVGLSVLVVLGIGTAVAITRLGGRPVAVAEVPKTPETVAVRRMDLAERESVSGDLGYGTPQVLTGRRPGTITGLPAPGAVLDRGATLYSVDARPVVLFLGAIPLYRAVGPGVTDGPDVKLVEENLRDLGYSGFGTPDPTFTAATGAAIEKWQKALGVDRTGVIELGDAVVTPKPVRVDTVKAVLGAEARGEIFTYTGTTRLVTAEVDDDQKNMAAVGTRVTLTIEGKQVPGTVTSIVEAPPVDSTDTNTDKSPKFTVTLSIGDVSAIGAVDAGSVGVELTSGARQGVLVVPVGALLALVDGGYAVELTSGKLVAVTTGLFADGLVEVSGDGLSEGTKVVTTS
jgi:peptidoglycan hydrolase-like protein with peptidoglycan-binding domain